MFIIIIIQSKIQFYLNYVIYTFYFKNKINTNFKIK